MAKETKVTGNTMTAEQFVHLGIKKLRDLKYSKGINLTRTTIIGDLEAAWKAGVIQPQVKPLADFTAKVEYNNKLGHQVKVYNGARAVIQKLATPILDKDGNIVEKAKIDMQPGQSTNKKTGKKYPYVMIYLPGEGKSERVSENKWWVS